MLVLATLVDLTAIASLGSVVALALFLLVAIGGLRLRTETASNAVVIWGAILTTLVVLLVFAIQTLRTDPQTFTAMIGLLLLAVGLEYGWSAVRRRRGLQPGS